MLEKIQSQLLKGQIFEIIFGARTEQGVTILGKRTGFDKSNYISLLPHSLSTAKEFTRSINVSVAPPFQFTYGNGSGTSQFQFAMKVNDCKITLTSDVGPNVSNEAWAANLPHIHAAGEQTYGGVMFEILEQDLCKARGFTNQVSTSYHLLFRSTIDYKLNQDFNTQTHLQDCDVFILAGMGGKTIFLLRACMLAGVRLSAILCNILSHLDVQSTRSMSCSLLM